MPSACDEGCAAGERVGRYGGLSELLEPRSSGRRGAVAPENRSLNGAVAPANRSCRDVSCPCVCCDVVGCAGALAPVNLDSDEEIP